MIRFHYKFMPVFIGVLAVLFASGREAAADRIGGSSLPPSTPALKGRLAEDGGATSVFVLSAGGGATSNAGPTFAEEPSGFLERAIGYAKALEAPFGRLNLNVLLADRHYTSFDEADERSGNAGLSLVKDWGGQQTSIALAVAHGRDVEERLTEASAVVEHAWTGGKAVPYVKVETALLDFNDIPDPIAPFRNQDDRDRVSSRAQVGLKLTLTEHVAVEVGGGADSKRYLDRYDDFGVQRDSVSLFPLAGLALTGGKASFRAVYMPFRRFYREDLFPDVWKHGYAVDGHAMLSDALKAFVAARYGFEETDFLIASAAYESVVLGGLVLTLGKGSVTLAASETRRSYDGLELVGVARDDSKREVALYGEMPLLDKVSLTGRLSYMDYRSTFGPLGTDMLTASLGLTYVLAE